MRKQTFVYISLAIRINRILTITNLKTYNEMVSKFIMELQVNDLWSSLCSTSRGNFERHEISVETMRSYSVSFVEGPPHHVLIFPRLQRLLIHQTACDLAIQTPRCLFHQQI